MSKNRGKKISNAFPNKFQTEAELKSLSEYTKDTQHHIDPEQPSLQDL
jgi:hypothetical protein